jgi:hypothetical protein
MEEESKVDLLNERISGMTNPEDIMLEILSVFNETTLIPDPGKYYTFVYRAKTPDINYDQHPLVAVLNVERWGFRGINFHWNDYRNYTWEEVLGSLHLIDDEYINDLRNIKYAEFKRS